MEDYLQLKTTDIRNEVIRQKLGNIYQKSGRKMDFQVILYPIALII